MRGSTVLRRQLGLALAKVVDQETEEGLEVVAIRLQSILGQHALVRDVVQVRFDQGSHTSNIARAPDLPCSSVIMQQWNPIELWIKRQLSRSPRAKRLASAVRRRLLPAFRHGEASRHWDERVVDVESAAPQGWLDVELVEVEHIRPQVTGDPEVSYLQSFLDHHLVHRPVDRLASLGCGGGNLERALVVHDAARRIDAFDVSPESIELARRLADEAGFGERIRYEVTDIDRIELEPGVYDAVVIKQALHHFEALEHVYEQIRRALVPGGVFMFNEFVGPSRFQWTDAQLDRMNAMLRALPKRIRRARAGGDHPPAAGPPT